VFIIKRSIIFLFFSIVFSTSYSLFAEDLNPVNTGESQSQLSLQSLFDKYLRQYNRNRTNPRLIHNLAVISYKQKHYDQSKVYFLKLLSFDKYHLIAKYNLGLVCNKLGQREQAIDWFKKISAHTHASSVAYSAKLEKLAVLQLKKLGVKTKSVKSGAKKSSKFKTYVFAKAGNDDYVSDPNVLDALGKPVTGDSFLNIYGLLTANLNQLMPGLKGRISYYLKDYNDLDNYDYELFHTDVEQLFKQDRWRYSIRLGFDQSTYGITDYQSVSRLDFNVKYKYSKQHKFLANLRHEDISSDDIIYDIYEGDSQRLDLQYDITIKPHSFRIKLGTEFNDRADNLGTNNIVNKSYSATREKIELSWVYRFNKLWKGRLKHEQRNSRYNDYSNDDSIVRDESRAFSSAQLKYRITKGWWWVSEYSYADNVSNISRYSYTRNIFSTGVTGFF